MNPLIQFKKTLILPLPIALALVCFGLSPTVHAVLPAPDGGYAGENTAEGDDALFNLTTGNSNTALGFEALYSNTAGFNNTATGHGALHSNIGGAANTATGGGTLFYNTTGSLNTATGVGALTANTTGIRNTATGAEALNANTSGSGNTATGDDALEFNSTGSDNTATGHSALSGTIVAGNAGGNNTANGAQTLQFNTNGFNNTASGVNALQSNTTGNANTANGVSALRSNTTGGANTANGASALAFNTTGGSNIALGQSAGINLTTGSNNIEIGNPGVAGDSGKIRIGTVTHQNTFIAGIYGVTVAKGIGVVVDSAGQLGTKGSTACLKETIKPMDNASEAIHALKPVTFRYKHELDPEGIPQFGLVAEEVAEVNPDLVARDGEGKIYTVRDDAVNAMLLNEFLKEHRTVQELKKEVAALTATVKEQASQIQKVSAKVEVSKPPPQFVENN
jgi:hypothetical protein